MAVKTEGLNFTGLRINVSCTEQNTGIRLVKRPLYWQRDELNNNLIWDIVRGYTLHFGLSVELNRD